MFNIELYKNNAESNRLDKTNYLENRIILNGNLREGSSIINPVIIIEGNIEEIKNRNYALIVYFNRYYFIKNYILITTNLIQLELYVDVLMSFRFEILNLTGYLSRTGNKDYQNVNIEDEYLKFTGVLEKDDIDILPFNVLIDGVYTNFKGFSTDLITDNDNRSQLLVVNTITGQTQGNLYFHPKETIFGIVKGCTNPNYIYSGKMMLTQFLFSKSGDSVNNIITNALEDISYAVIDKSTTESYILNILVLPYKFSEENATKESLLELKSDGIPYLMLGINAENNIKFDSAIEKMSLKSYRIMPGGIGVPSQYFRVKYERYYNDFRDFKPYTTLELELPFYGNIEIDQKLLIENPYIHITYVVNYTDGSGLIYIGLGNTDDNIANIEYLTLKCIMGINIPLNSTNLQNRENAILGQSIMTVGQTIGGFASGFGKNGLMGGMTGAASSTAVGISNVLATSIMNPERGLKSDLTIPSVNFWSNKLNHPILHRYRNISSEDPTEESYNNICGRPSSEIVKVSLLKNGGFSIYFSIHMDNISATSNEKDEIEKILMSGFLY